MPLPTHFTLNNGMKIPAIGMGTYDPKSDKAAMAVEEGLKMGYRHLDCARFYPTEADVGRGIVASGVPRSEIFITSKIWNTRHSHAEAAASLEETLSALQTDYLDLLLIHWPLSFREGDDPFPTGEDGKLAFKENWTLLDTWRGLEKLVDTGKVKAIGVSNFMPKHLDPILKEGRIKPVCNQVECHILEQQAPLLEYCKKNDILMVAYSPLGHLGTFSSTDENKIAVTSIAEKLGRDPAQVMLSYQLQRGICVIPKSFTPSRLRANLEGVAELPQEAFDALKALDKGDAGRQHGATDFHKPYPEWMVDWLKFD